MTTAPLADQRVIVIGGTSGIGFAVAEAARAAGARALVASSGAAKVEAAVARLGEGAAGAVVDVRDEASVAEFFEEAGPFDHLVFTAGDWDRAMSRHSIDQMDLAAAQAGPTVRLWGALLAVKHALPRIAKTGSITLTSGTLAHRPMKGAPLSTAFGGGVEHLAKGLAVDLAPLRVNAVCAGLVMTEATRGMPESLLRQVTARCLIPRAAEPEEVARAYLYLMTATYTTGQVLIVDGGVTLG